MNQIKTFNSPNSKEWLSSLLSYFMSIKSIDDNVSEDVYTVDLMDAYAYLGEIIGEDISDDLVDRIFSEFCMGK